MDQKAVRKQSLLEFIELYRQFPCLWRVKSVEYRDRNKKREAYDILIEKYKEIDTNATQQIVKNKIDSLRGAFRKELKRMKESRRSGAGSEEIYQPHLWYFEHLTFLTDHETPRDAVSSIDDVNALNSPEPEMCLHQAQQKTVYEKRSGGNLAEEDLKIVSAKLDSANIEDKFDVNGKNITNKLRTLSSKTAIVTEKLLSDSIREYYSTFSVHTVK
ncbi:hypothetical protein FQR65_LT09012 [Abscondita terminalis]|nr:hypothetical protein FQR65_LT09012 [Abscondita terminalis]